VSSVTLPKEVFEVLRGQKKGGLTTESGEHVARELVRLVARQHGTETAVWANAGAEPLP